MDSHSFQGIVGRLSRDCCLIVDSFEKNYPAKLKSAVSRIMRSRVLVSLIDNPALLTDVLESVADRVPLTVRSLNFHASGGRFPRISTVFEYQPALGEVVRRFGS